MGDIDVLGEDKVSSPLQGSFLIRVVEAFGRLDEAEIGGIEGQEGDNVSDGAPDGLSCMG